jgi:hypothetical protein
MAARAGLARLAMKQRTLHPRLIERNEGNALTRALRRG